MKTHTHYRAQKEIGEVGGAINKEAYVAQLKGDHKEILEKHIPEIEAHFLSLINAGSLRESLAIVVAWKWFADFSEKLRDHFEMEDRFVFPYLLGKGTPCANASALEFMRNHCSFEEQLREYILVMCKTLRPLESEMAYRMLIRKLERLEEVLLEHGEAEDVLMS
jgi:iron-sulfur cluster repair protein YtfE (RIC family)